MPEFNHPGRIPASSRHARIRRFANAFQIPGGGEGTIVIEIIGNSTSMAWEVAPDPPADTDKKVIRIRLSSNPNIGEDQVEIGIRNKTGYMQINNNTDTQVWRVDEDGMQFCWRTQDSVNSSVTLSNTELGSWIATNVETGFPEINGDVIGRYDFSSNTNLTVNSGAVQVATDLSGSGNHLEQNNTTLQPPLTTITGGSQAAQLATTTAGYEIGLILSSSLSQPFSFMIVGQFVGPDGGSLALIDGSASKRILMNSDDRLVPSYGSFFIGNIIDGGLHTINWDINGASSEEWVDGTSHITDNAGTSAHGTDLFLGPGTSAATGKDFKVAEFLVVNGLLSTADKNKVGNFWANKYGLSWTNIT